MATLLPSVNDHDCQDGLSDRNSGGVAVAVLDDAAELLVASDFPDGLNLEVLVENLVVHSDSVVWPAGIVVVHPCSDNVVEVLLPEADEVIQALPFQRADEGLCGNIGWRYELPDMERLIRSDRLF